MGFRAGERLLFLFLPKVKKPRFSGGKILLMVGLYRRIDYHQGSHKSSKLSIILLGSQGSPTCHARLQGDIVIRVRKPVRQTCEHFIIQRICEVVNQNHVHTLRLCSRYLAIRHYNRQAMDSLIGLNGEDEFVGYVAPVGKVPSS